MSDTFDENPSTLEENVLALMRTIKGPGQASETEQKLSCALDKLSETQRMLDLREHADPRETGITDEDREV